MTRNAEAPMTKILVIEDNDGVREEIVDILRFEGYDVLDAENGRIGLALVREWGPDLVVCDLMMPELDGYGTLEALRGNVATAALPFLCLTARGEQLDMQKAAALGADGYLTKPFTTEELLAALADVASKRGRSLEKSVA
jgi:CheY-like chemotaxis protein